MTTLETMITAYVNVSMTRRLLKEQEVSLAKAKEAFDNEHAKSAHPDILKQQLLWRASKYHARQSCVSDDVHAYSVLACNAYIEEIVKEHVDFDREEQYHIRTSASRKEPTMKTTKKKTTNILDQMTRECTGVVRTGNGFRAQRGTKLVTRREYLRVFMSYKRRAQKSTTRVNWSDVRGYIRDAIATTNTKSVPGRAVVKACKRALRAAKGKDKVLTAKRLAEALRLVRALRNTWGILGPLQRAKKALDF